jgi:PBP1b-binding outer membrane lipoprotein LpoB
MVKRAVSGLLVAGCLAGLAGCNKTAVNQDAKTSFLTSSDLVSMTDQMAMAITGDPDVAQIVAQKPMIIVMKPIENQTNEIIRQGQKELYVHRVRVQLSSKPALRDKFQFVLNRADYEKLRREEGLNPGELGTPEDRVQPEYALWGTFYANTNAESRRRSDTYLCTYRLTKISGGQEGQILWEGKYETSKHIKKDLLD